jgi:hypothetical protein
LFFLNLFKYYNKYVVLGGLSDYESIVNIRHFFNLLGSSVFYESSIDNFNSDSLHDVYTVLNLENTKYLLMISLNLRLEMPILNSKFLRKKDKIKFYNIGTVGYFYSNYFKYLGNSSLDVINFVYGKTILNKELYNSFSFDMNIFNNSKVKPHGFQILIGQSFYFIKNSFILFSKIKFYVQKYFNYSSCNNLFSNVSVLNFLNLNHLKKFKRFANMQSSLYFLNNVDNYFYLKNISKENSFIVYRGSFFDEGAKYSDLIFPSTTFFEENLNYKSFDGLNLYTRKVVSTNFYNNKEFFFFFNNLKIKFFKLNLFSIINFTILCKYFKFLRVNFFSVNYFFNKGVNLKVINSYKFLVENKIFNSLIINYYKTDVYSRNSKNIALASLEYLKTIITYSK